MVKWHQLKKLHKNTTKSDEWKSGWRGSNVGKSQGEGMKQDAWRCQDGYYEMKILYSTLILFWGK